ncbi:hypothetical protein DB41_DP00170 [Neochlamydia sp. TUME1]|nr:hypothetical protein DB41_DP00170 [Neochlamydia sp. TUME1]
MGYADLALLKGMLTNLLKRLRRFLFFLKLLASFTSVKAQEVKNLNLTISFHDFQR